MRIEFAPTTEVDKFPDGFERFLDLAGIKGALITDKSSLADFALDIKQRNDLSNAVGYIVTDDMLVWKILRDLEAT